MPGIEFYGQHLYKNKAKKIVLESGQPAVFEFAAGSKRSTNAVGHPQLRKLLVEVASNQLLNQFKSHGRVALAHRTNSGPVSLVLEAVSEDSWHAELTPGVEAAKRARAKFAAKQATESLAPGEPEINRYLRMMSKAGASDLHMSSQMPALIRLDGEMKPLDGRQTVSPDRLSKMMEEICPEKNWAQFTMDWDTDFAHEIPGLARYRANYFMDRQGPGLVMREIPYEILSAKTLGIPERVLDLCWLTKGLVLVTGPTGSGKSTTLAAMVDFINENRSDHIITIEDPIEFVHPNKKCLLNQREVGVHTRSFKAALKAALREDPDIILVGEMRDLETIAIAIETAETGHLVFGTLHTTSAPSTVDRIIDQFPADRQEQIRTMLSESLRGVISQVLCKKKGGGRIAAHEILITSGAVSNLIREGKTYQLKSVMQTGRKLGMQTMNECLFEHVMEGRVEAEEAYMKSNDKLVFRDLLKKAQIPLSIVD